MIANKADGNIRLCVGLGTVKKAIMPNSYPLPAIEEISAKLYGFKYFSKLGMRCGYLYVPLAKEFRYLILRSLRLMQFISIMCMFCTCSVSKNCN